MDNKNTVISTKQSARERRMIRFLELYSRYGVFAILALIVIVFTILSGIFLTLENILAIFQQASFTIVVACGMTMLLISGCTDLSAGALVAFCGMLASVMIQNGQPEVLAIFAALIAGIIGSTINGVLIGYFGLLPFMTTLSTQLIFRGLTYIINNGVPVPGFGTLVNLSRQTFLGISYLVWIALILVAVTYVILQFSNYGRRVYAVGGNREAAAASGISVKKNLMTTYVIMGLFCGIAGIMLSARTNSGQPNAAEQLHFDAITAAVIGGTSMTGGIGNILSTLVGAIAIACINNGMNLVGISSYYQLVVKGIIIIAAILIDKKSRDALFRQ